jgi:hypothetical protein
MAKLYYASTRSTAFSNLAPVARWIQEKQQLEVMLAWDLLETFNTAPELIGPLRVAAEAALREMLDMPSSAVLAAINAEKKIMQLLHTHLPNRMRGTHGNLNAIKNPGDAEIRVSDLETLASRIDLIDAQYCSDIVRLYGTAVENLPDKTQNTLKDSHRIGGLDNWNQLGKSNTIGSHGRHRRVDPTTANAIAETRQAFSDTSRYYSGRPDLIAQGHAALNEEHAATMSRLGIGGVQDFLISQGGGQAIFKLAETSSVARLDRIFGLVEAADISGTTADTIYFLNRFLSDPVFYLLPLATIVAGGHHSLVEVALPLSLNGFIDYHIGYYQSLLPLRPTNTVGRGFQAIRAALAAAESSSMNRHMMVFYAGPNKVAGCILSGLGDGRYRSFASGRAALQMARSAPAWPTVWDVTALARRAGIMS